MDILVYGNHKRKNYIFKGNRWSISVIIEVNADKTHMVLFTRKLKSPHGKI